MKIEQEVELKQYTTFRMGGVVSTLYCPETEMELIDLVLEKSPKYYIGGGSNIIANNRRFDEVVSLKYFNNSIEYLGEGIFMVGASVRLQKLISTINEYDRGGIEYLFSVPGLVGGAVVMNAGRGKDYHACISDYILKVKVLKDGEVTWVSKDVCSFGYRTSIFQNGNYIVLAVEFQFPEMDQEKTAQMKAERIALCRQKQDNCAPNFGTVFCEANKLIMQMFKYLPIGTEEGISYSKKTTNWMLNKGGNFIAAVTLIEKVERMHKAFGQKCRREVIIWE